MRLALLALLVAAAASAASAEFTAADVRPLDEIMSAYAAAPWKEEFMSLVQVSGRAAAADRSRRRAAAAPPLTPIRAHRTTQQLEQGTEPEEQAQGGNEGDIAGCEVCVYVVESKQQHQPYLCRGLKDPNYQKSCVKVMESLMWWLTNQVYWMNYGCTRTTNGATSWVRPCPAHAVCSWIEDLSTRTTFCPADINFKKPE